MTVIAADLRNALIDNYNTYAVGLDSKRWELVRSCFADEVYLDYGELSGAMGGPDVATLADDWVEQVKSVINGFDVTRHTITNHRFSWEDGLVCCRAYLIADHVIFADPEVRVVNPENVVTLVGEYTNCYRELDGQWRIVRSRLVSEWLAGNGSLLAEATARAAQRQT